MFLYSSKESLVIVKIFDFEILGFPWSWELPDQEYAIEKKCLSVRPSVRSSVTLCGAETTDPIFILNSGNIVEKSGDGAESILVPLTLTTRRLEPENLEKTRKKIPVRKPVYRFWLNFDML